MACKGKMKRPRRSIRKAQGGAQAKYLEPVDTLSIQGPQESLTRNEILNTQLYSPTVKDNAYNTGSSLGYASTALGAYNTLSDQGVTSNSVQQTVDLVGSNVSPFYSMGKTVDQSLFAKDPNTGLYESGLAAAASYGITDPGQSLSQAITDAEQGDYWQSALDMVVPAFAGLEYQKEAQEAANKVERERQQSMRDIKVKDLAAKEGTSLQAPSQLYPMGGKVPYGEIVELERGEPFMTPDGKIHKVSDDAPTHANGGVVLNLPGGTKVLGKKLKGDKTFKQLGSKLHRSQKELDKANKDNPGTISTRTKDLMNNKLKSKFNKLFIEQGEDIGINKFSKGGKVMRKGFNGLGTDPYQYPDMITDFQYQGSTTNFPDTSTASPYVPKTDQFYTTDNVTKSQFPSYSELIERPEERRGNIDYGNLGYQTATLSPIAYNLIQGLQKPRTVDIETQQNPYTDQIRSAMRNRRYNISPELEANRLAEAAYYRNLREAAPSKGQYLAGLGSGQLRRSRADAAAIARKQNIDNQYLAEQASMDASLGASYADRINRERYFEEQAQAQTDAARQRMLGTGLGQAGQYAQTQRLMKGQESADEIRMNLLNDLYSNYIYNQQKQGFQFRR